MGTNGSGMSGCAGPAGPGTTRESTLRWRHRPRRVPSMSYAAEEERGLPCQLHTDSRQVARDRLEAITIRTLPVATKGFPNEPFHMDRRTARPAEFGGL